MFFCTHEVVQTFKFLRSSDTTWKKYFSLFSLVEYPQHFYSGFRKVLLLVTFYAFFMIFIEKIFNSYFMFNAIIIFLFTTLTFMKITRNMLKSCWISINSKRFRMQQVIGGSSRSFLLEWKDYPSIFNTQPSRREFAKLSLIQLIFFNISRRG